MVSLTRHAAEKIRNGKHGKKYIRVFTADESGNFSNFEFSFTDGVNRDDILYMSYGIKILVDSKTRKFFENLKIDYVGMNGKGNFLFRSQDTMTIER